MHSNQIAFVPDRNHRGRDMTGAFLPGAVIWRERRGGLIVKIDVSRSKAEQRAAVLEVLEAAAEDRSLLALGEAASVAFFCHGTTKELQIGGWRGDHLAELARAIAHLGGDRTDPRVSLYACSAGDGSGSEGDGGLADRLRDELCGFGATRCVVLAHTRSGHSWLNRYKRRFVGDGTPAGGIGGGWWVAPGSSLWKAWAARQRDLWWRLPDLEPREVHMWLNPPAAPPAS